jgi:hypothetical protein
MLNAATYCSIHDGMRPFEMTSLTPFYEEGRARVKVKEQDGSIDGPPEMTNDERRNVNHNADVVWTSSYASLPF